LIQNVQGSSRIFRFARTVVRLGVYPVDWGDSGDEAAGYGER